MSPSKIEWTNETWNPVIGCDRVSPGCAYCYAKTLAARFKQNPKMQALGLYQRDGGRASGPGFGVQLRPEVLGQPLRWKRPRRIFVNSMSDLFLEDIPTDFICSVFEAMFRAPQHQYQILTKRPGRMKELVRVNFPDLATVAPNVWLGVSAENQRWADERIPILLDTPAAIHFVSLEPLLGPINLRRIVVGKRNGDDIYFDALSGPNRLDWVIVGGESAGPPKRALVERCSHSGIGQPGPQRLRWCSDCDGTGWRPKPTALAWVRSLHYQCLAAGVPWFWKQWGGRTPSSGGRLLDGRTWDEMPA